MTMYHEQAVVLEARVLERQALEHQNNPFLVVPKSE